MITIWILSALLSSAVSRDGVLNTRTAFLPLTQETSSSVADETSRDQPDESGGGRLDRRANR